MTGLSRVLNSIKAKGQYSINFLKPEICLKLNGPMFLLEFIVLSCHEMVTFLSASVNQNFLNFPIPSKLVVISLKIKEILAQSNVIKGCRGK